MSTYPPGSLTWNEIVAAICALPEHITGDDVGTVATLAGILGVFGFPEGSTFREKPEQENADAPTRVD